MIWSLLVIVTWRIMVYFASLLHSFLFLTSGKTRLVMAHAG